MGAWRRLRQLRSLYTPRVRACGAKSVKYFSSRRAFLLHQSKVYCLDTDHTWSTTPALCPLIRPRVSTFGSVYHYFISLDSLESSLEIRGSGVSIKYKGYQLSSILYGTSRSSRFIQEHLVCGNVLVSLRKDKPGGTKKPEDGCCCRHAGAHVHHRERGNATRKKSGHSHV